ncbi:MAG: glycosyltransferase family 4 protein [Pyrobaculum arsenaticum]|uniref:Glycosyl transferase, group 1 n=2 Tax=Pyrobaculum arsenaticum TaxID=121277 RepID=A4WHU9_PYRAR|nr:glycosyltransferase family 4 protein [Pyrobaculum arsenaticum]ABP49966.1 glycosyl transferase, group 1 [Pyrobaculum arsenaticum DSM 13514]MCY0891542.1 glycosyltransferase family 4 protein [Pyrobaculum arsenaticum]NYR16642.1 glycosyltransferase family 4 protein [Pyrobaculum arsenaticum]
MRILFVAPSYYPHVGGVEYVVKSVAERLAKLGHEVAVLAGEPGAEAPREEEVNGVRVVRWPVWSPGGAYHVPRARRRLEALVRDEARVADVIHLHSVHSVFTMHVLRAAGGVGARKVLTPHYHGTGHTPVRRALWTAWRIAVRRLLKDVDVVHAVSPYEAELVEKHFGRRPVVVEHGVEEWITSVEWRPENYVMYSGRIEKYKNVHRLGNIVKLLNERGHDLELRIYGDGPYRRELERRLKRAGVKHVVEPPQPYEKYIEALSRAALFALLSEKEAFGQTINEANAVGTPAVAAEPWGKNFAGRPRTLIVPLQGPDEIIADKIKRFLEIVPSKPKPIVPTWSQVVARYLSALYI